MEDSQKGLFNREFLDKWYNSYHKLEAIVRRNGTANVELGEELTSWADIQRGIRHMLPTDLKSKLEALNFNFEEKGGSWEAMYRQLAVFVRENGYPYLPDGQEHEALKDWLIRQILNKSLLSESQFRKLNSLGVDWDMPVSRDHRWELMYARLKYFYKTFGHSRVPQKWGKDKQLAHWVTVQRRMHTQGKLRGDRERKLGELNFVWNIKTVFDSQWERYFKELTSFFKKHGHCRVPGKYTKLESWIERQRTAKANNLLPAEREERLNGINFAWSFRLPKRIPCSTCEWIEQPPNALVFIMEHLLRRIKRMDKLSPPDATPSRVSGSSV